MHNPGLQALVVGIVAGVAAQWLGQKLRIPALILLLALGVLVGPQVAGLIPKPPHDAQVLGSTLDVLVKLGVAVILFEGGLSLNLSEVRLAPRAVRNLLTLGAAITFAGAAGLAYFVAGLDWRLALLFGSLMIVTGPTVIVPLLKNLRLVPRLHTTLLWEGILIDAVGAIAAFMTFELVFGEAGVAHVSLQVLRALLRGPLTGLAVGFLLARWLRWRIDHARTDPELDRLLALAGAFLAYGLGEYFAPEGGLAAVTVAGIAMSRILGREARELKQFKGVLTTLLVSTLFILLAADFDLRSLPSLGWRGAFAVAGLMLVVRPVNVWLSTTGSTLRWREKIFLGWIAPRGIVAASVVSLFALELEQRKIPHLSGAPLEALTFAVILATVVLSGLTAKPLAWLLGLRVDRAAGLLIVGVNQLSVRLAKTYEHLGYPAVLVDNNSAKCEWARSLGLRAIAGSALDADLLAHEDLAGIGGLIALTPSAAINKQACAITASALNLQECHTVLPQAVDSEDWRSLRVAGVEPAFGRQISLPALEVQLASLGLDPTSVPAPEKPRPGEPPTKPIFPSQFLPLVVKHARGVALYTPDGVYPDAEEFLGIDLRPEAAEKPTAGGGATSSTAEPAPSASAAPEGPVADGPR